MENIFYASVLINLMLVIGILAVLSLKGPGWCASKLRILFRKNEIVDSNYERRNKMFEAFSDESKKNKIIFLGDSHVGNGMWEEIFNNSHILNRGIGGDTSFGVLQRVGNITFLEPRKLFIMVGINDLSNHITIEQILDNYKTILDIFQKNSPKTEIFVHSTLPINNDIIRNGVKPSIIIEFNEGLKKIIEERDLNYIDLYSVFVDNKNHLDKKHAFDGIHLNAEGYMIWKQQIEEFVNV